MPRNTDKRPLPQQHKRSHHNNYHGRGIYMITLCTDGRLPLLGTLTGDSPETAAIWPVVTWIAGATMLEQYSLYSEAVRKKESRAHRCTFSEENFIYSLPTYARPFSWDYLCL